MDDVLAEIGKDIVAASLASYRDGLGRALDAAFWRLPRLLRRSPRHRRQRRSRGRDSRVVELAFFLLDG